MTDKELAALISWFNGYVEGFHSDIEREEVNYRLKREHTLKVAEDIVLLAGALGLEQEDTSLARAAAYLHDIGRFPQFREYGTFKDSDSVNHGELSAEILEAEACRGALGLLPAPERRLLADVLKYHNSFALPRLEDRGGETGSKTIFMLKLLRDADKLDIWRVFVEYYEGLSYRDSEAASMGMPETPELPADALEKIFRGELVSLNSVRNLNGLKLMQLAWVYGLNFRKSFELLRERRYVPRIIEKLPAGREREALLKHLENYIDLRLRQPGTGKEG
jgi:putative nucleotidyltransferase with HDIG domain